jgi:hypothetical protein
VENNPSDSTYVQRLRIRNDHPYAVQFSLEPWAEEVTMPPNGIFEIIAKGPQGDFLDVMLGSHRITVYGWSGSVASVFNGAEQLFDCQIPVPELPLRRSDESGTV